MSIIAAFAGTGKTTFCARNKNAIDFEKRQKAKIDKKVLFSLLQNENIRFKESDFSSLQKWIIFSYMCQEKVVKIEYLDID